MAKFLTPLKMGDPKLLMKSEPVDNIKSTEIQEIIEDLFFTIQSIGERVGLAAPQVGILKRIVVFRVPNKPVNPRYKTISDPDQKEIPWSVLINPIVTPIGPKMSLGWEGCVSVPGMLGEVLRYDQISYSFYDQNGEFHQRDVSGFHARLIQHECDHLDGILFPMKVSDISRFGFEEEIQRTYF